MSRFSQQPFEQTTRKRPLPELNRQTRTKRNKPAESWQCLQPARDPWCVQSKKSGSGTSISTEPSYDSFRECIVGCKPRIFPLETKVRFGASPPGGAIESAGVRELSDIIAQNRNASQDEWIGMLMDVEDAIRRILSVLGSSRDLAQIGLVLDDPLLMDIISPEPELLARLVHAVTIAGKPRDVATSRILYKMAPVLERLDNHQLVQLAEALPAVSMRLFIRLLPQSFRQDEEQARLFVRAVVNKTGLPLEAVDALTDFINAWSVARFA